MKRISDLFTDQEKKQLLGFDASQGADGGRGGAEGRGVGRRLEIPKTPWLSEKYKMGGVR
jgi:hypothetical protein